MYIRAFIFYDNILIRSLSNNLALALYIVSRISSIMLIYANDVGALLPQTAFPLHLMLDVKHVVIRTIIQILLSSFSGTDYFYVVDGKLFANASLDRDVIGPPGGPGPHIKIQVRCVVWEEKTGMQHVQTNVFTIDVLDEDDNPPTVQGNTSIAITLQEFSKVILQY